MKMYGASVIPIEDVGLSNAYRQVSKNQGHGIRQRTESLVSNSKRVIRKWLDSFPDDQYRKTGVQRRKV